MGGGGALGAGGAVFVGKNADLILSNVSFTGNKAVGGSGATYDIPQSFIKVVLQGSGGGGGGGLLGDAAPTGSPFKDGTDGGPGVPNNGNDGQNGASVAGNGQATGFGGNGLNGGGGGGGGKSAAVGPPPPSPIATKAGNGGAGGNGLFGGGGGAGGTGGNGGSVSGGNGGAGGIGGFGAGGGAGGYGGGPFDPGDPGQSAGTSGAGGSGGYFAGDGGSGEITYSNSSAITTFAGGGGGAGFGGAIFVQEGGSITVLDTGNGGVNFSGNSVKAGIGGGLGAGQGGNGSTDGATLYMMRKTTTIFDIAAGRTDTFTPAIGNNDGTANDGTTILKKGLGTVVLQGNSPLVSKTTVDQGTLNIVGLSAPLGGTMTVGPAGTLIGTTTSFQNSITDNGRVVFSQGSAGTYSGVIAGSGAVEISGLGAITFTGLNTYTGGTIIDNGSTLIGTTSTVRGAINTSSSGNLQFNAANGTYSGALTGTGNLFAINGSTLTLSGNNSGFSGTTTVDGTSKLIGTTDSIFGNILNSNQVVLSEGTVNDTYGGNISGSGSLQITTGAVTLSGANTYTGGTTVNSGASLIGTTNSLQRDIVDNGQVTFNQSGSGNYSGILSGTGSVRVTGSGPVTFSGLNTYSGGTTIDAGSTLIGSTKSLQGNFQDNGLLKFNQGAPGTFGGIVSGTGQVQISGTGAITFTGLNTYTGGTIIDNGATLIGTTTSVQGDVNTSSSGNVQFNAATGTYNGSLTGTGNLFAINGSTLTLSGDNSSFGGTTTVDATSKLIGTTDSIFGNILNSNQVVLSAGTLNTTYSGVMTGSGSLQIASGSVTLSGANNYTGGTTVDSGTILIGTTTSLRRNIVDNGRVVFNQSTAGTYTGILSGTGSVLVNNVGPVTFSGANTYSGGTTINAGSTLIGSTTSLQGNFQDNGLLRFSQAVPGTFGGIVSGTGRVQISGPGAITFTGLNTYTGGTTIDNGSTLIGTTSTVRGAINTSSSGNLQFNAANGTYSGALTGTGNLFAINGSTLTLSGNNSGFSGTTTVDGTSKLIGTTDSIFGNILNSNQVLLSEGTVNDTYGGNISGSGSLQITSGAVTLSGANTYTGGTIVNSGTTLIGTTNSLQGNIDDSGLVIFNQATAGTFSGLLSGTGAVEIAGTGPITFAVANTYSGGTKVDVGATLIGTTSTLPGSILDNGLVKFDQAVAGTYSSVLSGTGAVEIAGTGPITFTGANSYSGGTKIDVGSTLIGSTTSLQGNFQDNGLLKFKQAAPGTFGGSVSGTGQVEISGTGAITFTGLNTYTGGTIIDDGSTLIGTTSSLQGNINTSSSGNLKFNAANGTYSGSLTGTGNLFAINGSTLTLSGNNSGFGGTTTVDGTSKLIGTTDSIFGNILNSNQVVLSAGTVNTTYGGAITGSGSLQIASGAVTLSGANNYTGGTTVDSGATLIGTTTSLPGSILDNGRVIFNQSSAGTYTGILSGTGAVEIAGVGPITFTGANTYSGGTVIDNGATLIGSVTSLQGNINTSSSGKVDFDSTGGTFAGVLSGSGSLLITGGTNLTLSGINSGFTGTTTVDATSTLTGTTDSIYGNIINNNLVTMSAGTTNSVYSGNISGSGSVDIAAGVVTFQGTNTYAGVTNVNATLIDLGSISGSVSVNAGGVLKGNGSVGNTTIQNGGTLAPGVPGSALTVNGNLNQAAGSTYTVELNKTTSDKVVVTGTTTISATGTTLNVIAEPGKYTTGTTYTILSSQGGINGQFATNVFPQVSPNQFFAEQYVGNDLKLLLMPTTVESGEMYANLGSIAIQTTTVSLQHVSNRLANLAAPDPYDEYEETVKRWRRNNSEIQLASYRSGDAQISTVSGGPVAPGDPTWNDWAIGYGLGANFSGGFNYSLGGTLFGVDHWLDDQNLIGVLGGYAGTSVSQHTQRGTGNVNTFQVGAYGLHREDLWYISNIDAFANETFNVSRQISDPGVTPVIATGGSYGNQWSHYTEVGMTKVDNPMFWVQPFMGLQYILLGQFGVNENGGGFLNMQTDYQVVNSVRSNIGLRYTTELGSGQSPRITPLVAIRYQHEFGDGAQLLTSTFEGAPNIVYATAPTKTGNNIGLFTVGSTIALDQFRTFYANLDAQVAGNYRALIGSAGFQFSW